jgi:hypothetical protein
MTAFLILGLIDACVYLYLGYRIARLERHSQRYKG